MELAIVASLESKANKLPLLNIARLKIELLKRLLRITWEIDVIESKKYLYFESELQELSKMTNGWINYLKKGP